MHAAVFEHSDTDALPGSDDTHELTLYRAMLDKFVEREIAPHQTAWLEAGCVDRELWRRAGQLGVLLADVPEMYGGGGGNFRHMALLWEALAMQGETGFGTQVHAVVAQYLLHHGTEQQKQRYLPRLASGELIAAIAITEPDAGSDLQGLRTECLASGNGYVLNGSKTFVSNGSLAGLVLVAARTCNDAKKRSMSLFLVETDGLAGYELGAPIALLGRTTQDTRPMHFADVRLNEQNLLGGVPGRGMAQMNQELCYERLMIAVSAAATMERAVMLAAQYSHERRLFGKTLFDLQHTRIKLAECKTITSVASNFVRSCIHDYVDGALGAEAAAMAKWYTTEQQCRVIDDCLQLFGGYGYALDYPIARMYADARVQKIYGGSNEVMKELIACQL